MIVKLWDRKEIIVTKEQAVNIERMIAEDYKLIDINGNKLKPAAIAGIFVGGPPDSDLMPPDRQLLARNEISDEQRDKNRLTIARLKQQFIDKLQARKNTEASPKRS